MIKRMCPKCHTEGYVLIGSYITGCDCDKAKEGQLKSYVYLLVPDPKVIDSNGRLTIGDIETLHCSIFPSLQAARNKQSDYPIYRIEEKYIASKVSDEIASIQTDAIFEYVEGKL